MPRASHPMDSHFVRNTFSISAVEFFWGLGLPLVAESAFLQIYLRHIGASQREVGMIPAILSIGFALGSPLASFVNAHLSTKRVAVALGHMIAAVPLILFAALSFLSQNNLTAPVFLGFYAAFSCLIGLGVPLWQNYLATIFSPRRTFQALSIMWISQVAGRILSGYVLLDSMEQFAFSRQTSSLVFAGVGTLFAFGASFFLLSHEEPPAPVHRPANSLHILATLKSFRAVVNDKPFLFYLLSTIETTASITVLSFYATFAMEQRGIAVGAAAGGFTIAAYCGGMFANLALGMGGFLGLKQKLYLSKGLALTGILALLFAHSLILFLCCSALIGFSRNTNSLTHVPTVKRLAQERDATDYFSLAPFLTLPFSFGIPALSGYYLDASQAPGESAFQTLFLAMAGLVILSTVLLMRVELPEERSPAKDTAPAPANMDSSFP